jgi:hypothetical protein
MLSAVRATVIALLRADTGSVLIEAIADGEESPRRAVAYPALTGAVSAGDRVLLNVTATNLHLGTGGVDFVVAVDGATLPAVHGEATGCEHVVKLRYTPLQHAVRVAPAADSGPHPIEPSGVLQGVPVVVCELHSQIAPVCAAVRAARASARIVYVMTDVAALPIAFSDLVRALRVFGLLDATVTAGQAFGGDHEAVSDASALIAARTVARGDVVVIAPGPGSVGTGTQFGFSGVGQGALVDLALRLGGAPVGVLRLSLADPRERHRGLSHHTVTSLGLLGGSRAVVAFPEPAPPGVDEAAYRAVRDTVAASPLAMRHAVVGADGAAGMARLAESGVAVTSMGRSPAQDPLFFYAAAAAGVVAAEVQYEHADLYRS